MNTIPKIIAAVAISSSIVAGSTFADDPVVEVEKESAVNYYAFTGVKSGYICDGYLIYDHPALQSGAGIIWAGLDVNVWNTWALGKDERTHYAACGVNEIDYQVSYTYVINGLSLKASLDTWNYPDTDDTFDDWLAHTIIAYEDWWLRPEIDLRWGIENQKGCYGTFKLSKEVSLADSVSLKVYDYIAYASKAWREVNGEDKNGFVDNQVGAEITWYATSVLSFNAGVEYNVIVDSALRDAIDNGIAYEADGDKQHVMYYAGACLFF